MNQQTQDPMWAGPTGPDRDRCTATGFGAASSVTPLGAIA